MKCDGTRAETRFRLSAKRTSPFTSAGASVLSTTGSRAVRISGSNAGYTMLRGSVKSTGYPLHSQVSSPVRHSAPSHFNWTLPTLSAALYQVPKHLMKNVIQKTLEHLNLQTNYSIILWSFKLSPATHDFHRHVYSMPSW